MKKRSRLLALLLSAAMVASVAGCGNEGGNGGEAGNAGNGESGGGSGRAEEVVINGITYHPAADLTTENIELTYFHFDQDETVKYLADRFMELVLVKKWVGKYSIIYTASKLCVAMSFTV